MNRDHVNHTHGSLSTRTPCQEKTLAVLLTNLAKGRQPMANEPDVALLMRASDSFDDEHELGNIKKDLGTQALKSKKKKNTQVFKSKKKTNLKTKINFFFVFILETQTFFCPIRKILKSHDSGKCYKILAKLYGPPQIFLLVRLCHSLLRTNFCAHTHSQKLENIFKSL